MGTVFVAHPIIGEKELNWIRDTPSKVVGEDRFGKSVHRIKRDLGCPDVGSDFVEA